MADLEALRAIDEAYLNAGEAIDQKYSEIVTAHSEEIGLARRRAELYQETLDRGFFIKKVADPRRVSYHAGYVERGSLFTEIQSESKWMTIDESHAEKLAGAFATGACISWSTRSIDDVRSSTPQPVLKVSFEVAGVHDNAEVSDRIERDGREEEGVTRYSAELAAIEWRLPTEEEIQAFGSLATEAAQ